MMVHGPCGLFDSDIVCMKEGKCGKKFPKKYNEHTFFDADGYVHYRRRETNTYTTRWGVDLDNSYIVPYNRELCLTFHAHINVEYCGWSMLIKYLFKYISKGTDKIAAKIVRPVCEPPAETGNTSIKRDEIQNFIDGSFICPHEACWRILKYEIHSRQPAMQILSVHLENYFTKEFVWYPDSKSWRRRQRRTAGLIGRLANVHPTSGELFYLRMLLCYQTGCKTFEDIRTVNKILYPTFHLVCEALRLLGDNREWHTALEDSAFLATSQQLRSLFSEIFIFCDVADPLRLWKSYWRRMSDDIPKTMSDSLHIEDLYMNDLELEGGVLYELMAKLERGRQEWKVTLLGFTNPERIRLPDDATTLRNLYRGFYDEKNYTTITGDLQQKAIVCPKNSTADDINATVLEVLHGGSTVYTSSDEAIHVGIDRGEVELLYPPEYLNTLQFSGFPPYQL
ncbi:DNA helicase [Tanacetum coccineum]